MSNAEPQKPTLVPGTDDVYEWPDGTRYTLGEKFSDDGTYWRPVIVYKDGVEVEIET